MRPKLTAPTYEQRLADDARRAQLEHDAKHAPGPALPICDGCGDEMSVVFGQPDGKFCFDCVSMDDWLRSAREHREAIHG